MSDQRFYFSVAVAAAAACFGCITSCIARGAWIETPRGAGASRTCAWATRSGASTRRRANATAHASPHQAQPARVRPPAPARRARADADARSPGLRPGTMRWRPAGDWVEGRARRLWVLDERGPRHERVVPARIESGVGAFEVFDLTVDHQLHNYVAHGVLVHNKSPAFENNFESVNPCDGHPRSEPVGRHTEPRRRAGAGALRAHPACLDRADMRGHPGRRRAREQRPGLWRSGATTRAP